jgi:predicted dehydrogenase/nucleoside-diphosphate-sugar epimerase
MSLSEPRGVLVTGAAGFIGRDLVTHLLRQGYRVAALVRDLRAYRPPPADRLVVCAGDLRDPEALRRALAGNDAVVHLAARKSDEPDSVDVNVEGARRLVGACRDRGVRRLINVSTQSVKLPRRGAYGETKAAAEAIFQSSGLAVTTLRPSVVYGADRTGVFARMRDFLTRLPVVPVIGDGRWRSRPIHVRDVSEAIAACLERDATIGQIYDLGGPDDVTMDEFLDAIGASLGLRRPKVHVPAPVGLAAARVLARLVEHPPVSVSNVLGSTQDTHCDPSRAAVDLGVVPVGLVEGLERTLDDEVRARHGRSDPILRVAVVGLGKMGLFHATLLSTMPEVRLAGLADTQASVARAARSMGFTAPFYRSLEALLATGRVQAVVLCTPTDAHAPAVRACLESGVHVLVEKPLTDAAERSEDLAALAGRAGVVHAVGYHLASSPIFERARSLLADRVLGDVHGYEARLLHGEVLGPKRGWMFDPARAGGGVLRNTASHLIFVLEWYFGLPAKVRAQTTSIHSRTIEDALTAALEYENGLTGTVEASWSVPGKAVMEVHVQASGERGSLAVNGTEILLDLRAPGAGWSAGRHRIHVSDLPPEEVYDLAPEAAGAAYYRQDRDFVRACLAGSATRTPFDAAARVDRIIDGLYASAARGAPVSLE